MKKEPEEVFNSGSSVYAPNLVPTLPFNIARGDVIKVMVDRKRNFVITRFGIPYPVIFQGSVNRARFQRV